MWGDYNSISGCCHVNPRVSFKQRGGRFFLRHGDGLVVPCHHSHWNNPWVYLDAGKVLGNPDSTVTCDKSDKVSTM